ncbi:hypothetical protein LCGC14_1108190 [marine sediment metagenome]|uniref:Uncharacterized protein n=1 Tax=marine sediment metagenome TaxID=412755 RepID=A0A0F9PQN9_9ZZZZ
MKRCPYCHKAIPTQKVRKMWLKEFSAKEKPYYKQKCNECGEPFGEHYGGNCPKGETKEYKCAKCGLEIIILKSISLRLPKAECQNCGTKTMRPTQRPTHDLDCKCRECQANKVLQGLLLSQTA